MNGATFFDAAGLDTALATPGQLTLGARYQHLLDNGYRVVLSGNLALLGHSNFVATTSNQGECVVECR